MDKMVQEKKGVTKVETWKWKQKNGCVNVKKEDRKKENMINSEK